MGSKREDAHIADYSDIPFVNGDITYTTKAITLRDRNEAVATEVETARQGSLTLDVLTLAFKTEIEAAREGEASLLTNISTNYINSNITVDVDLNSQKIVNAAQGTSSGEGVTKTQLEAIEALGAGSIDQSVVDATTLADGTATSGQRYVVDGGGTAIVGEDNVILTLDTGTLTANQIVGADTGATTLEAKDVSNISAGSITPGERVMANASIGLQVYETPQASSIYASIL